MTLCVSDIKEVKKSGKVLNIVFEEGKLMDSKTLSKLVDSGIQSLPIAANNKSKENIEWRFKCKSETEAAAFVKQVQLCRNDPKFQPNIDSVLDGYRSGKGGFRPHSVSDFPDTKSFAYLARNSEIIGNPFRGEAEQKNTFKNFDDPNLSIEM